MRWNETYTGRFISLHRIFGIRVLSYFQLENSPNKLIRHEKSSSTDYPKLGSAYLRYAFTLKNGASYACMVSPKTRNILRL